MNIKVVPREEKIRSSAVEDLVELECPIGKRLVITYLGLTFSLTKV